MVTASRALACSESVVSIHSGDLFTSFSFLQRKLWKGTAHFRADDEFGDSFLIKTSFYFVHLSRVGVKCILRQQRYWVSRQYWNRKHWNI